MKLADCGQLGANSVASRTPFQSAGGRGARHRRGPVGGAAYGSPRNAKPPDTATPRTAPPSTTTTGLLGSADAATGVVVPTAAIVIAAIAVMNAATG